MASFAKTFDLSHTVTAFIICFLAICISAQLSIPLNPVPITFQNPTVILLALTYGFRLSTAAVFAYLLAGALGLPVFAEFYAGLPVLLGDNGGYLLGFLVTAMVCGYLSDQGKLGLWKAVALALLGSGIVFVCGFLQLSAMVGFSQAYLLGVKPFLILEPIKLIPVIGLAVWFKRA